MKLTPPGLFLICCKREIHIRHCRECHASIGEIFGKSPQFVQRDRRSDESARPAYCDDCAARSNRLAASIGLQSKELGRDSSLPLQDHRRPTTLRSESAQSAHRGKDRMQHAQSNEESGHASLSSAEVTGGAKIKAQIAIHSRTNAVVRGSRACHADRDGVSLFSRAAFLRPGVMLEPQSGKPHFSY